MSDGDDQITKSQTQGHLFSFKTVNELGTESTSYQPITWLDSFTGAKNPRWRSQVRAGIEAGTNCLGQYGKAEDVSPCFATCLVGTYSKFQNRYIDYKNLSVYGCPVGWVSPSFDDSAVADAENTARSRFYSKARSALSAVMAGQDLGEYKETVHGIQQRGTQLFRTFPKYIDSLIRDLEGRRGYLSKLKRKERLIQLEKRIADLYLEYNFGWSPLIKDIDDSIAGVVDSSPMIDSKNVSASAKSDAYQPIDYPQNVSISLLNVDGNVRMAGYSQIRYKGAISVSHERGARIREQLGATLDNFVPTVYELIPYSFVVDYFSNLGDVINSLFFLKSRVNWVCRTHRTICSQVGSSIGTRITKPAEDDSFRYDILQQSHTAYAGKLTTVRFDRTVIADVPIPTLALKWPTSGKIWTNLGALVLSRTKVFSKLASKILE